MIRAGGDPTGKVDEIRAAPGGPVVVAATGLYRYDNHRISPVQGSDSLRSFTGFQDAPNVLLLVNDDALYRYDGRALERIWEAPKTTWSSSLFSKETSRGLLMEADDALYQVKGDQVTRVPGDATGHVADVAETPDGPLLAAKHGLFRYDGARVVRLPGGPDAPFDRLAGSGGTYLAAGEHGLWLAVGPGPAVRRVAAPTDLSFPDLFATPDAFLVVSNNRLFQLSGDRLVAVPGELSGHVPAVFGFRGGAVVTTDGGLFIYRGGRTTRAGGDATGRVTEVRATPDAVLLAADKGLFRLDGDAAVRVGGEATGEALHFLDTPYGVLVQAQNGLFRYDGGAAVRVSGEAVSDLNAELAVSGGYLLAAMNGLFRYDGDSVRRLAAEQTDAAYGFFEADGELLAGTAQGLFRVIREPLSGARATLENAATLSGSEPGRNGVPTRWTLTHPCAPVADKLGLQVEAVNEHGAATAKAPAVGFQLHEESASFQAVVPVPDDGQWTFRVSAAAAGADRPVGRPSPKVHFITHEAAGLWEWFTSWWKTIAGASAGLLIAANLAILGASRWSASAWRMATDESWTKSALTPQRLLLRHSRAAQLWLLDLYVHGRRAAAGGRRPFMSMPLAGPEAAVDDSEAVLGRVAELRRLWVQGGAGMGKTALFLRLAETHFGGAEATSFAVFRRRGCILVPVEARRFAGAPSDETGGSGWVVDCAASVLSASGLAIEDRGLLRAMLNKGTLAVAVDGLNEAGRGQAVAAFAAEFPAAPLFVTSQEAGEAPFAVWRLPRTIAEHVDGLLALYLGAERGAGLARRLRELRLMEHLRSGYDVRLVIDLAQADADGAGLPRDRVGLYRAAVTAGWPDGDDRRELLKAAAWRMVSDRGPAEDKRPLKPDEDAPRDLLEQLEAARERSGRSIRLIRGSPSGYEFVHDQMNAYLAACWLAGRPSVSAMREILAASRLWQDGAEAQRSVWAFAAAMLDRNELEAVWVFAGDDDRRAVLGRALAERAEREGWSLTRPSRLAEAAE